MLANPCPPLPWYGCSPQRARRVRYHGDFDWGGLRIAGGLFGRFPMQPWRYDADAYQAAVAAGLGRIEEELVLDDLIGDLAHS